MYSNIYNVEWAFPQSGICRSFYYRYYYYYYFFGAAGPTTQERGYHHEHHQRQDSKTPKRRRLHSGSSSRVVVVLIVIIFIGFGPCWRRPSHRCRLHLHDPYNNEICGFLSVFSFKIFVCCFCFAVPLWSKSKK